MSGGLGGAKVDLKIELLPSSGRGDTDKNLVHFLKRLRKKLPLHEVGRPHEAFFFCFLERKKQQVQRGPGLSQGGALAFHWTAQVLGHQPPCSMGRPSDGSPHPSNLRLWVACWGSADGALAV